MTRVEVPPTRLRMALALVRGRGIRWFAANALEHLRARWALRAASRVGTARLRGRAYVRNGGDLTVGDRVRLDGSTVRLELVCFDGARLSIGEGTFINYGTSISATSSVQIGGSCDIGQYAIIMDNDYHHPEDHSAMGEPRPVVIEDGVWLGARVTVLPGARIGRGSVIGAHAVVKGDIPPYSLAAGVPARVVRSLRSADDA